MSQAEAAAGLDRLPWLADEPSRLPQAKRAGGGSRGVVIWAIAAILLVAAASYWMGTRGWEPTQSLQSKAQRPSTTVQVPQPVATEPAQPQVVFQPAPQVSPPAAREVPMRTPRAEKRSIVRRAESSPVPGIDTAAVLEKVIAEQNAADSKAAASVKASPDAKPLKAWPASQSQGAKGRIVRIGAFGSRQQAKLGWRHMVGAYPAVAHLKATVVSDRNSLGRHFYRFQIGTTSQAHSEVLCQRMEKIHFSCAVVGLPGEPKGVER